MESETTLEGVMQDLIMAVANASATGNDQWVSRAKLTIRDYVSTALERGRREGFHAGYAIGWGDCSMRPGEYRPESEYEKYKEACHGKS